MNYNVTCFSWDTSHNAARLEQMQCHAGFAAVAKPQKKSPQLSPLRLRPQVKGEWKKDVTDEVMNKPKRQRVSQIEMCTMLMLIAASFWTAEVPKNSVTVAAYRWRSIHFEEHMAFLRAVHHKRATDFTVVAGTSCGERHPYLSLSQATEWGRRKKRVDSACMYAGAGSHKSWPSSIYTGSILMVSYLLHSLSPGYIVSDNTSLGNHDWHFTAYSQWTLASE